MENRNMLEVIWWGLFSAGGVVAAFLVPGTLVVTGLAVPLGMLPPAPELFAEPLVRLYLFVLISLPLFHWAHRFYFTLNHLGLHALRVPLAVLCYGGAVVGTLAGAWILLRI